MAEKTEAITGKSLVEDATFSDVVCSTSRARQSGVDRRCVQNDSRPLHMYVSSLRTNYNYDIIYCKQNQ